MVAEDNTLFSTGSDCIDSFAPNLQRSSRVRDDYFGKAAELFIHTDQNINETAFEAGFSNVKYFQKQLFKLFGMNPSEYIRKYRNSLAKLSGSIRSQWAANNSHPTPQGIYPLEN